MDIFYNKLHLRYAKKRQKNTEKIQEDDTKKKDLNTSSYIFDSFNCNEICEHNVQATNPMTIRDS